MEEHCSTCKQYQDHVYWNHLYAHFFQPIYSDSFEQFRIPKKFARHFREKLSETVTLKGPSGHVWHVELTKTNDGMSFQNGWQEFVKDHFLEVNDLLVFTYAGDSQFDVLIFDRSGCEKESSYFVNKHENRLKGACQAKEKDKEQFMGPSQAPQQANHTCRLPKKHTREDQRMPRESIHVKHPPPKKQSAIESQHGISGGSKRKNRTEEVSIKTETLNSEPDASKTGKFDDTQQIAIPPNGCQSYYLHFVSHRKPVTEEEKDRTYELALAFETVKPAFAVVMRPTHVYRGFFMTVPADFVHEHLHGNSCMVVLRIATGKTWDVLFDHKFERSSGLRKGWSDFVFDNNLEEGDVCIFELNRKRKPIVLDVHIFRVVKEVVPLTKFQSSASTAKSLKFEGLAQRDRPPKKKLK